LCFHVFFLNYEFFVDAGFLKYQMKLFKI